MRQDCRRIQTAGRKSKKTGIILFLLFISSFSAFFSYAGVFSESWYQSADGSWRIRDNNGKDIVSSWVCDDSGTLKKDAWYFIDSNGRMVTAGIVRDQNGSCYSLETAHNGHYGMMHTVSGSYGGIYLDIETAHDGNYGKIRNPEAADALAEKYGFVSINSEDIGTVYTSDIGKSIQQESYQNRDEGKGDEYRAELLQRINQLRSTAGALPLKLSDEASECSEIRCGEAVCCFAHKRPDGRSYKTVFDDRNMRFSNCGEILAYGYRTTEDVFEGWRNSAEHCSIMINSGFTDIGISRYISGNTVYWECLFYTSSES